MKKLYPTANGGKSKYRQPDKARYYEILRTRNNRMLELGFIRSKRKRKRAKHYETVNEHIQANVCVDPVTGCWIWTKALQFVGYGFINIYDEKLQRHKMRTVHRVAYEAFKGPIPPGKIVMHSCDVTYCANPDHLSVGTIKENYHDMMKKGRHVPGNSMADCLLQCPHCDLIGQGLVMSRWHFDHCRNKPVFIETSNTELALI